MIRVAVGFTLRPREVHDRGGPDQHREFRWCLHEASRPVKVSSRAVEQHVALHTLVLPGPAAVTHRDSRSSSTTTTIVGRDAVWLGRQVGRDDRLISLRRPVVGDKKMLIRNVAQRKAATTDHAGARSGLLCRGSCCARDRGAVAEDAAPAPPE